MKIRAILGTSCACAMLALVASAAVACSGDDAATPTDTGSTAGDGGTLTPGTGPGPTDAGGEGEGEETPVTEEGDLPDIDPDAGGFAYDGGLIAVPGCLQLTPGPYASSTCSSSTRLMSNVGLQSGTYVLSSVTVLGTTGFCADTFKTLDHSGALVIDAASPAQGTLRFMERYRSKANPLVFAATTWTASATTGGGSLTLALPGTCLSGKAPPSASVFGSGSSSGKKFIVLTLPYGASGKARYRFVEP